MNSPIKSSNMELYLTAVAVGLLFGLAYSLAGSGALEASTIGLVGLVVIVLGQITSPYLCPFGVGLLLGLSYDTLEDEWYEPTVSRNVRPSYRARLLLKEIAAAWAEVTWAGGGDAKTPRQGLEVDGVFTSGSCSTSAAK